MSNTVLVAAATNCACFSASTAMFVVDYVLTVVGLLVFCPGTEEVQISVLATTFQLI